MLILSDSQDSSVNNIVWKPCLMGCLQGQLQFSIPSYCQRGGCPCSADGSCRFLAWYSAGHCAACSEFLLELQKPYRYYWIIAAARSSFQRWYLCVVARDVSDRTGWPRATLSDEDLLPNDESTHQTIETFRLILTGNALLDEGVGVGASSWPGSQGIDHLRGHMRAAFERKMGWVGNFKKPKA